MSDTACSIADVITSPPPSDVPPDSVPDAMPDVVADVAPDLDVIESDLDAVQTALVRLDDGTYWTDEVTGEPIAPERLVLDPLTRRA